ncbi:hypothetical protein ACWIUA_01885 [Ursidibacter sp. B-7004-1]
MYIIMQTSIPMEDLADIEIIKPIDDEHTIQQKITRLYNNMESQIMNFKLWHQQGNVLTPEQSEQLLHIQPMVTAYFSEQDLYNIDENVASMDELNQEFQKYNISINDAIFSAKDSTIADENIISWIKEKFTNSNPESRNTD